MRTRKNDRAQTSGRYEGLELRLNIAATALVIAMLILCVQFWRLQVVGTRKFEEMAYENTVTSQRLVSNRGIIYGRNNDIVANNRASADIVLVPGPAPRGESYPSNQHQAIASLLESLIGISADNLLDEIKKVRREPFTQITVKRDVSRADLVRIEESAYALTDVFSVVRPQRRYPYGETAGQILGYLGVINDNELAPGYARGDLVGRSGLERRYESLLHGRDGNMVVTKYAWGKPQILTDERGVPYIAREDSRGNVVEQNYRIDPQDGDVLHLTLDMQLQRFTETLLQGEAGAIVVLDAESGEVLSLASAPNYDPSVFVTRGRSQERVDLLTAGHPNPMLARAFRENYPPGSVFKIMIAAAALEEGTIDQDTTFFCPGFYQLPNVTRRWHCWQRHGHGHVSIVEALAFSCDVFFYNAGNKLGVDKIAEWAHIMGLGQETGIDLPSEIPGIIPDRAWKAKRNAHKERSEQRWYPGETLNLSIGQGATTTPLQNAVLMATILNGGRLITPHLNRDATVDPSERFLTDETLQIIQEGMRLCVEKGPPAPTGTGKLAKVPGFDIIGKTGSAQVTSLTVQEKYETEEDIPYRFKDHAWFVAGVLDREPKIAICILVEHGHHGSSVAAPFAKDIVEFFYADQDATPVQLAREAEVN